MYVLAVIDDDGPRFVIGEIDTFARTQNETAPINKLKSFTVLNYEQKKSQVATPLVDRKTANISS